MNLFIPILMLFVPGIIAVSVHNGKLIHITRENWQLQMWMYVLYSFAIVFVAYFVMFIIYPENSVSFSPWTTWTNHNVLQGKFFVKYSLLTVAEAFVLPKIWAFFTKRKTKKIADDE